MEELVDFSYLIESIYDAALDADLWPQALEQICAFVQGCGSAIYYYSIGASASFSHSWGYDPVFLQSFQDTYSKINPFFPSALFIDVGKTSTAAEFIPMDEFRRTRLYKEWARPQGLLDAVQTSLERSATGAAALTVHRRERDGLFDAAAKSRFALLVPHVQRAIAIGKVVEFHQAKEAALADTLDTLDDAVLLVARDGLIVHLNKGGSWMVTAADVLQAPHGRLIATDARANTELQAAIAGAALGDTGLGVKGIAISLASDGQATSQVAHVLSLVSGTRRGLLPGQATAALFVRRMTAATPLPLEIVARRYGLTTGEVRVLAALADVTGVAALAALLGIAESTVKTHLRSLFAKTGKKRQADLVKLLSHPANAVQP